MRFATRQEAGQKLAVRLRESGVKADLVLGLPRGGVVVAAAVARELGIPLGAQVVRKIGHPLQREFAVGALAEHGIVVWDRVGTECAPLLTGDLERIIAEETQRLRDYQSRFHPEGAPSVAGRSVIIVDDGLATGATCEAGVLSARTAGARRVIVAAPVASTNAEQRLRRVADDVHILRVDPMFEAVGLYYDEFAQTTDDEVVCLLREQSGA